MNECPCGARINYPIPCETCRRRIAKEAEERPVVPGEQRGLNPMDPRFFNIPGTSEPYQP